MASAYTLSLEWRLEQSLCILKGGHMMDKPAAEFWQMGTHLHGQKLLIFEWCKGCKSDMH